MQKCLAYQLAVTCIDEDKLRSVFLRDRSEHVCDLSTVDFVHAANLVELFEAESSLDLACIFIFFCDSMTDDVQYFYLHV